MGILDTPPRWGVIGGDITQQEDLHEVLELTERWVNKTNSPDLGESAGSHIRYPTEQAVYRHVKAAVEKVSTGGTPAPTNVISSAFGYQPTQLNDAAPYVGDRFIFNGDSLCVADTAAHGTTVESVYSYTVAKRFGSENNYRNDHVGGSTTGDLALRLLSSSSSQYQDSSNPNAARPEDEVILNVGTNDAGFGAAFLNGRNMYANGMETILGVYQSLVNLHSDWVLTGSWSTVNGPFSNNGTAQQTTEVGAKVAKTFTVFDGKGVIGVLMAPADASGAQYTARIDGVVVQQGSTVNQGFGGDGTALKANFTPVPITYQDSSWVLGSTHTLEVEYTGGTGPLIMNSVHSWGVSPEIRVAPVVKQSDDGWALFRPEYPQYRADNALVDSFYRPTLTAILAKLNKPKIKAIRAALYDQLFSYLETGLRADPVHANNVGQLRLSQIVYEGVLQPLTGTNPDAGAFAHISRVSTELAALEARARTYANTKATPTSLNAKDFGAKGDGSTDDTAAIDAMIAAMPSVTGPYGGAGTVLYFPEGRYITRGSHVIPANKRCRISGASEYGTYLMRKSGAVGDLLTIQGSHSSIENISLDGNRSNVPANSDSLVLDAAYCSLNRVSFYNAAGTSLVIGKTVGAICTRLNQLLLRSGLNYGIHVVSGFGSTDGMWSNIDVGTHGKSGIRVSASAQMMVNVHAWGCGLEDTTDNHGIWLDSTANHLVGCESETNLGAGVRVNGSDNSLVGGWFWGNVGNGVYILNGARIRVADCDLYRNGVFNTAGSTSTSAANIRNEGGTECQFTGNNMWDDALAINGGGYAGMQPPTYPYPGRTAVFTVSYHLAEINGAENNTVTGNMMVRSRTRTGTSHFRTSDAGKLTRWTGNHGVYPTLPTISSASVILVPGATDIAFISGTTTIDSILGGWTGRTITLRWTAAGGTVNASNFALSAAFTAAVGSVLMLQYDGTTWYEVGRAKASQRLTNDVRMDVAPRFTGAAFTTNTAPAITGYPLYISSHTTGDITFTLPSNAGQESGITFEVVRGAAGGVTVLPPSGGSISGASSYVLSAQYSSARFVSSGQAGVWIRTASV